jgi:hypothetical protein
MIDTELRWRQLARRAFEVPDIVSDDNGETAIAYALRHGFDTPPEGSIQDAEAVVAAVIELGGLGKLDELFMLVPDRADRRATLMRAVSEHPSLRESRGLGPLEEDRRETFFDTLIEAAFAKITRYVTDHPFED